MSLKISSRCDIIITNYSDIIISNYSDIIISDPIILINIVLDDFLLTN